MVPGNVLLATLVLLSRNSPIRASTPLLDDASAGEIQAEAVPLSKAVWNRQEWESFKIKSHVSQYNSGHPCSAGFTSMRRFGTRCKTWRRTYVPVGGQTRFDTYFTTNRRRWWGYGPVKANLVQNYGGLVNMWDAFGDDPGQQERDVRDMMGQAIEILINTRNDPDLKPVSLQADSWITAVCRVAGTLPFRNTCSDHLNILTLKGKPLTRWTEWMPHIWNWELDASAPPEQDNLIVFWEELLVQKGNPYEIAESFLPVLVQMVEGNYGSTSFFSVSASRWFRSSVLNQVPTPLFEETTLSDWNIMNAGYLYAEGLFSAVFAMAFSYASQDMILGQSGVLAIAQYRFFDSLLTPWGRNGLDYFLTYSGKAVPSNLEFFYLDFVGINNPFASFWSNFHVALATQCIGDPSLRPVEPEYQLPSQIADLWWDCSSYETFWTANTSGAMPTNITADLHYGGAVVFRLALPEKARIEISADAAPEIRTKVLAAGDLCGTAPAVKELRPGEVVTLPGCAREVFLVQVNVDPAGESVTASGEHWKRDSHGCGWQSCVEAWQISDEEWGQHPKSVAELLRSPQFEVPMQGASLSFKAMWSLEEKGWWWYDCYEAGWDGVQIRVRTPEISVVVPSGGYPGSIYAMRRVYRQFYSEVPCSMYQGWTDETPDFDSDDPAYQTFSVHLDAFAGETISFEFFFASDTYIEYEGFWVHDMVASTPDGSVLFSGDEKMYSDSNIVDPCSALGTTDPSSGVPLVTTCKQAPDKAMTKSGAMRAAQWSASWEDVVAGSQAATRRQFVGWSCATCSGVPIYPDEEVCVRWQAPFTGHLKTATLWLMPSKYAVDSICLVLRSAEDFSEISVSTKASPGVRSASSNFFMHGSNFDEGEAFFICAGIHKVSKTELAGQPFITLPLRPLVGASDDGILGTTLLKVNATKLVGPWGDQTLALTGEWEEGEGNPAPAPAPPPAPTPPAGRGSSWGLLLTLGAVVVLILMIAGVGYCFWSSASSPSGSVQAQEMAHI